MPIIVYGLGVMFSGANAAKEAHAWEMEQARAGEAPFAEQHAAAILKEDRERAEAFSRQCAAERVTLGQRLSTLSVDIQAAKARVLTP